MLRRPLFALAFLAFALFGSIAAVASAQHGGNAPDPTAFSDEIPDHIAKLFATAWW